ncbi:MAG: hypothetical protein V3U59_00810, partial [Gammaproteobacteria bacterium]
MFTEIGKTRIELPEFCHAERTMFPPMRACIKHTRHRHGEKLRHTAECLQIAAVRDQTDREPCLSAGH